MITRTLLLPCAKIFTLLATCALLAIVGLVAAPAFGQESDATRLRLRVTERLELETRHPYPRRHARTSGQDAQ